MAANSNVIMIAIMRVAMTSQGLSLFFIFVSPMPYHTFHYGYAYGEC